MTRADSRDSTPRTNSSSRTRLTLAAKEGRPATQAERHAITFKPIPVSLQWSDEEWERANLVRVRVAAELTGGAARGPWSVGPNRPPARDTGWSDRNEGAPGRHDPAARDGNCPQLLGLGASGIRPGRESSAGLQRSVDWGCSMMDTNDIDEALSGLRQITILAIRTKESLTEDIRQHDPEAFAALTFSLNDILERVI